MAENSKQQDHEAVGHITSAVKATWECELSMQTSVQFTFSIFTVKGIVPPARGGLSTSAKVTKVRGDVQRPIS